MSDNVLVVHGGGPTAVINSSLYGVLKEAKECGKIGKVYGAMGGSEAILKERFLDLLQFPEEKLKLLLTTPATAIGSSGMPWRKRIMRRCRRFLKNTTSAMSS